MGRVGQWLWAQPERQTMIDPMLAVFGLSGGELLMVFCVVVVLGGLFVAALAVAAYLVIRALRRKTDAPAAALGSPAASPPQAEPEPLKPTNMAGYRFHDVNLAGADFENVNLTNARFHNINLSNVSVSAAQMGGAALKHIGPPPGEGGKQERQRPVRFEEMMLCDSVFRRVDLSNVRVTDCDLTGMTIDGLLVTDLIAAYRKQQFSPAP